MSYSEPEPISNERRKLEGPANSFLPNTPVHYHDGRSATPTAYARQDQDPKLLHHFDGYTIVRRSHIPFAAGGFCDIFIGDHEVYGKVAMRRPRMTDKGYTIEEVETFFDESRLWKKLRHPNILQFLGLIQSDGYIWAVSHFAENGSLPTYLEHHPETDRRALISQLADAIKYLHREGIVHGDVKGSNILVSAATTVLLCDFGLSKPSNTRTRPSLEGAASVRWCAPEVLMGEEPKTFASDVYSFAMTVYEILSGEVPFHTLTNDIAIAMEINKGVRPSRGPSAPGSGDMDELWNVIVESWDSNPSKRPNMKAVFERLEMPIVRCDAHRPIFGLNGDGALLSPSPTYEPTPPSVIPMLQMSFFDSPFYRRFHVQRPIIDPNEFTERYDRYMTGRGDLGMYGHLIAQLLVTWAASSGVDEKGEAEPHDGLEGVRRRRNRVNIMVEELLAAIDRLGVMRTVSWDGVRVLLLLMPLTEDVQDESSRSTMYQSTVLQIYSLSHLSDSLTVNEVGGRVDQMVRARIFWYGHVHEGLTNGLKGRKLVFDQDDVDAFRSPLSIDDYSRSLAKSNVTNSYTYQFATAPIRLSAVCRMVHGALSGPKAERSEFVDKATMDKIWNALADSWDEFESLRPALSAAPTHKEDVDRFTSGFQIFIFEALNVIREKLLDRIKRIQETRVVAAGDGRMSPTLQAALKGLQRLHDIAESRCHEMAGKVMDIIRRHVDTSLFEYDVSLCQDGVFCVGSWVAWETLSAEDLHVCLTALGQMRWAYSKSAERTDKLKRIWQDRQYNAFPTGHSNGNGPHGGIGSGAIVALSGFTALFDSSSVAATLSHTGVPPSTSMGAVYGYAGPSSSENQHHSSIFLHSLSTDL